MPKDNVVPIPLSNSDLSEITAALTHICFMQQRKIQRLEISLREADVPLLPMTELSDEEFNEAKAEWFAGILISQDE